jgi:hypothetical protein
MLRHYSSPTLILRLLHSQLLGSQHGLEMLDTPGETLTKLALCTGRVCAGCGHLAPALDSQHCKT